MKKTSKVKQVMGAGTWNSKDGKLMYKYDYNMEDGAILSASHQSENKFSVGDEVEYEIKGTNTYGSYGSVAKPGGGSGGGYGKGKGNNRSFALSYAKDLAVVKCQMKDDITTDQILAIAEKFVNWLDEN